MVDVGTLTTESDVLLLLLGVAQRRQRVGGLARLRDEQRKAAGSRRRLAIAELRATSISTGSRANLSNQYLPTSPA